MSGRLRVLPVLVCGVVHGQGRSLGLCGWWLWSGGLGLLARAGAACAVVLVLGGGVGPIGDQDTGRSPLSGLDLLPGTHLSTLFLSIIDLF